MFGISIFLIILFISFIVLIYIIIIKDTYLSHLRFNIKSIGLELEIKIENKEKSAPSERDKH
jgi:hypothetical protein